MYPRLAMQSEPLIDGGAVVPDQMDGGQRFDAWTSGELALRLALLEDAIRCLLMGKRPRNEAEKRLAREAEAWVRNLDRVWPFSFGNICDALNIDGPRLRRRLLGLRYPAPKVRIATETAAAAETLHLHLHRAAS